MSLQMELNLGCQKQEGVLLAHWSEETGQREYTASDKWEGKTDRRGEG